jgi:hypothetical protein
VQTTQSNSAAGVSRAFSFPETDMNWVAVVCVCGGVNMNWVAVVCVCGGVNMNAHCARVQHPSARTSLEATKKEGMACFQPRGWSRGDGKVVLTHVAKCHRGPERLQSGLETPQDTTHLAVFVQFTSVLSALAVGVPSKVSSKGTRKGARTITGDLHGRVDVSSVVMRRGA